MVHHSFLSSSPSIHSEKWILGHAIWRAHQVSHTTHMMLLLVSLYTRHYHQAALLKSATWRQGGGWGNKFISFPSWPQPISFHAVTGPKWIKISHQISASITTASSFLRYITWLLKPRNKFSLRWEKLERQPTGQRFSLGGDVSQCSASPLWWIKWKSFWLGSGVLLFRC